MVYHYLIAQLHSYSFVFADCIKLGEKYISICKFIHCIVCACRDMVGVYSRRQVIFGQYYIHS